MVILRDAVAMLPVLEVTVTTKGYVPATGFAPDITPVEVLRDKFDPPKPDCSAQVTGELQ